MTGHCEKERDAYFPCSIGVSIAHHILIAKELLEEQKDILQNHNLQTCKSPATELLSDYKEFVGKKNYTNLQICNIILPPQMTI